MNRTDADDDESRSEAAQHQVFVDAEATLAPLRARLLAARAHRVRPERDDKVLADWNGLLIAALANAGLVFDRRDWISAAVNALTGLSRLLPIDGRLHHSWCRGRGQHPATLDDYATLARAALALFEATGERSYIAMAQNWVAVLDAHYWDTSNGGYFFTADDTTDVIVRTRSASDNATPSGNGLMVGVLSRLYHLTGETRYRERADLLVSAFAGEPAKNFFPLATFLNSVESHENGLQIIIIGHRAAEDTERLIRVVAERCLPGRLLAVFPPGMPLPDGHPAVGKTSLNSCATAYVCRGQTCSLPITDVDRLLSVIDTCGEKRGTR